MTEANFCSKCGSELVDKEEDGRIRRVCSSDSCDWVFWNNPTPVVAAIVEHEGKVLLVRNKGWPAKWLGLVTGFLEKGETPEDGVLRELKEELGLTGVIEEFLGTYSFFEANQIILAFHVKAEGEVTLGDEIEKYRAFPPEKVKPWSLGTGPALKDWLEKRGLG